MHRWPPHRFSPRFRRRTSVAASGVRSFIRVRVRDGPRPPRRS